MGTRAKSAGQSAPRSEESLEREITVIREMIAQLSAQARAIDDVKVLLRVLDIISSASARLVGLLREQRQMDQGAQNGDELGERMNRIVVDIAREKGLIS